MMTKNVSAWTVLVFAALLKLETPLPAQKASQAIPPALPVFEWNECPFEGCGYRQWKAADRVVLYDTWKKSRREVGELAAGDKVVALTGVVITFKPGIVRIDRDSPSGFQDVPDFKRGDIILTYADHGLNETAAWYRGHYYQSMLVEAEPNGSACPKRECDATWVDQGHKEWWAKVKLRSGRTAWVWMDHASFGGVDAFE